MSFKPLNKKKIMVVVYNIVLCAITHLLCLHHTVRRSMWTWLSAVQTQKFHNSFVFTEMICLEVLVKELQAFM